MTAYLAYSYSTGLTKEEKIEIEERVTKSQQEFRRGFIKGTTFSLTAYSVYLLTTSVAHASDVPAVDTNGPAAAPKDTCVAPKPDSRPGFKPLGDGPKGAFIGGASTICATALQTGDFYLGVACSVLLVIGAIVVNRSKD